MNKLNAICKCRTMKMMIKKNKNLKRREEKKKKSKIQRKLELFGIGFYLINSYNTFLFFCLTIIAIENNNFT